MCLSAFAAVFAGGKSDSLSYKKLEKKYPQSEYFFSLGHGASLSNAESSAKLGICQSLGETLSGEQKTFQSDSSLGKQESSLSININETVLFQHITGIEIKETWQEKSGEWFAVAVLNKKKASDYYSSLAKEQGQKIQALITKAKFSAPSLDSANVFVRYNFASPVIEIASGSVVKPFNLQGREGHVSKEEAVNRCITRICQKIKEEF